MNEVSAKTIEGLRKLVADPSTSPEMARKIRELVDDYEREIDRIETPRQASALDDRRQRAIEAAYDEPSADIAAWIKTGIETATRVQITPEITGAYLAALHGEKSVVSGLEAAFEAAGFEVEP